MTDSISLLNPDEQLLPAIARQLFLARKTKPLWAKRLEDDTEIVTREGTLKAMAGDYLCRGIKGEHWPQKANKLTEKYVASGVVDENGWQRFEPKPDMSPVEAAPINKPFRVVAQWGELSGKAGDYVVRGTTDPTDIWIVEKAIFEASYELQKATSSDSNGGVDQ